MFELIRESAGANRSNVLVLYSEVPSIGEPFACLGEKSRPYAGAVYPTMAVKSFLTALQSYVAPYVHGALYEFRKEPLGRKVAYRNKKRSMQEGMGDTTKHSGWKFNDRLPRNREQQGRGGSRGGGRARFAPYSKCRHSCHGAKTTFLIVLLFCIDSWHC